MATTTPKRLRGMPQRPNIGIFPPGTKPLPNGPDWNLPLEEAVKSTEEHFGMKMVIGVLESEEDFPDLVNSWHVHHYFDNKSPESIREALKLRWDVMNSFPNMTVAKPFRNAPELGGFTQPTAYGQWVLEVHTPTQLSSYLPWIVKHHGSLNILCHPNTTAERLVSDHTTDAFWLGKQAELPALQAKVGEMIKKFATEGLPPEANALMEEMRQEAEQFDFKASSRL